MPEMFIRVATGLVGLVIAVTLHELTHYAVARVLPGLSVVDARLYPHAFVEYAVEDGADRAAEWANLAPTFVGLGIGGGAVVLWGWPEATAGGLTALLLWAAYTSPSIEDVLTPDASAESFGEIERSRARGIQALMLALVAWGLMMIGQGTPLWYIGSGGVLAAVALVVKFAIRTDERRCETSTHAGA